MRTISGHDDEYNKSKGPFEIYAEEDESNDNIEEGWDDVEHNDFQSLVDCCSTVQDAQDFAGLAMSVESEGKVEKMVE